MRVFQALHYAPTFPGGIAEHLRALGIALHEQGHTLVVAFPYERTWMQALGSNIEVLILPQIVRPLRRGFKTQFERLVRQRGFDIADLSFSFALPFSLTVGWRRPSIPIVFHWHNPPRILLSTQEGRNGHVASRFLAGCVARFTNRRTIDAHVVVSREIRDLLVRNWWAQLDNIHLLPNAIGSPPKDSSQGGRRSRGPASFTLGSVASFRPQKDHFTLIRAFMLLRKEVPDARLILVGDGPTRPTIERQVATIGANCGVEFVGSMADPGPAYQQMDAFVLSTHYEGQGLVLLEALAHGLPVVATDLPVIRETVRDGVDGLLVPASDPRAMAASLVRLARNPELRMTLGRSGREQIARNFGMGEWARRKIEIYESVLALAG